MDSYKFYYPVQIRYGDLDPMWHVNNARFLTIIEAARITYYIQLGLFDGRHFHNLDSIVANVHLSFLAPILLGQTIRVGIRTSRLGNKSMVVDSVIEDQESGKTLATCQTIMVSYNHQTGKSQSIPEKWRQVISAYEGIPPGPEPA
ncbi:MAG: acyl-CoA thioesterase [Anaerolineaceae bacterium]|nr:acyl-CoA thioesterase [Anaerolineaceae bacterium]